MLTSLPNHLFERVRPLNHNDPRSDGDYVLYWTHHAGRTDENPALDTARHIAVALGKPLLVYQGLSGRHRFDNDRHHTFILEGARDLQQQMNQRGIRYVFHLARDPNTPGPLRDLCNRASLVITEDFPAPPFPRWLKTLGETSPAPLWAVDTACIVPMQSLEKVYTRAFQFRKRTSDEFDDRLLQPWAECDAKPNRYTGPLPFEPFDLSSDLPAAIASCAIDHSIGPVHDTPGGSAAGYARWDAFCQNGLRSYARLRNDAALEPPNGVSRMSAYLHHGHVSPFRLAREAAPAGAGGEKYLDELLIWRELAHNFCFHKRNVEDLSALPDWARETLHRHRGDRRPHVYSWEQLAWARTEDALWNAAQHSLIRHGELHNNLRMTWGKALLRWTDGPESALRMMIDLNHRFALDGNDPNSYGGLLWCLGQFDRPFPPAQPIVGETRPRETHTHAARLDLDRYRQRVEAPSGRPLRIAVIGAGPAGLASARVLHDQGHAVVVLDKGRGLGGRTSRRRREPFHFDHGAQYFTARDPNFARHVESWVAQGVVAPWEARFAQISGDTLQSFEPDTTRFVPVAGMNALANHLGSGLEILTNMRVERVQNIDGTWKLSDTEGHALTGFDRLVVAIPAGQARELLQDVSELVPPVEMTPCWAVLLGFDQALPTSFDASSVAGGPLSWVARNNSKPGRPPGESWVLHASPEWSQENFELPREQVIEELQSAFFALPEITPQQPSLLDAMRWKFALAQPPAPGLLWDEASGLAVCGDWCLAGKIEGAWLSGTAAAGRILASAGRPLSPV